MRPQLFVIAMSPTGCTTQHPRANDSARQFFDVRVYPIFAVTCIGCHPETAVGTIEFIAAERDLDEIRTPEPFADGSGAIPLAKLRPAHMFDYSPRELSAILAWVALERRIAPAA